MKKRKSRALTAIAVLVVLAVIAAAAMKLGLFERKNTVRDEPVPDWVDVQLIDIDGASRRGVKLDAIVVDPPRKGVSRDVIDAMLRMAPKRIVYVSCDPATLARDVKLLSEGGYALRHAEAFDLFPRCAHVETVCLLSKL